MLKILFFILLLTITVKPNVSEGKGSLVFVFDTTGSMHDDLAQLQEGAEMILNTALEESNGISNFVFVPFHDPKVGPATVTTDKETFKSALASVRVHGGGDCPEKSITGLSLALNASLPRSFVYVFTDATAKDHRLVSEVLDIVQRKQSQVVFVLTGHCNDLHKPHYKAYQQIAAASSGQVFNLKKASVHKVLDFVRSSIKGRMVNLGSLVNPAGYNHTHGFPIDNSLGEVTVSVSGSKPQIRVVDPQGEEVTPPKLETTLDLSEIMVVKVHDPQPGLWKITVGSEAQHSVKVVGMSNLTFHHGFSVEAPKSMDETSHRPLQGALNHMLISLTESRPVVVNSASILDLEGKVIFEVPLRKLDDREYLTDAFLPPEDFFYVAINGYDEQNQELRRVAPTAVKAKLPDAPFLVVENQKTVKIHERVLLTCKIESLVPISAQWTKESERVVGPITSLQSTVIEYVIEDAGEQDAGSYRCSASNVAGITSSYTELTVLVDPPIMNLIPSNITGMIGEEFTIQCTVFSEAMLQEFRFLFNGTENYYASNIPVEMAINDYYYFNKSLKLDENDTGLFSCLAKNQGGITTRSTYINVLKHPNVQIIGPKTIETKINTSPTLKCRIENALTTYWLSPNNTVIGVKEFNYSFDNIIRLENVKLDDSGVWTCVGERNEFKEEDAITLKVTTKSQVIIESTKEIVQLYGTVLEIICTVIANPAPDHILWRKPNGEILNTMTSQTAAYTYNNLLILTNVTDVDENKYFCYAENSEGSSVESVDVKIRKPMEVVEGLMNQSIELYSQIDMTCNIDAYPKPKITWYHNATEIQWNRKVHKSSNNNSVFINKVDFDDFGVYECRAENVYENVTLKGFLSVCCLEEPVLLKDATTIHARKGRSITLSTSILKGNPYPDIKWQYKLNQNYTELPTGVSMSDDGLELNISKVEIMHEGTYRCEADNVLGSDFYEVNVIVEYPPQIITTFGTTSIEVEIHSNVTLPCEATGVPKPFVIWTKDGEPVVYSKNVYLFNNSLVISAASELNSGLFVCNATSPVGSADINYTVIVYEKPSISPLKFDTHIEVLEGQLVELPCSARGLPKPRLKWFQNGQTVDEQRMSIDDDFVLRFVANLTDFGEYTCRASNDYGNSSLTFEVFVWVLPSIEGPKQITKEVLTGDNVTLQCDVVGFPIPDVRWEFQNDKLIENTTEIGFNDVGVLSIINASVKHEGSYTCFAENIAGDDVKVISLQVFEPPTILSENFTGPYIASEMDTELLLPCRTRGKPTPFVAWSRDGRYIDIDFRYNISSEGTLVIRSLSEELKGNYTCVAKNTVGEDNRTVPVQIYALPMMTQADQTSSKVTFVEGSQVKVECPLRVADGDTLKWYKDAELVATGDLVLNNASVTEPSSYACVVTNAMGSWQATVDVEVEYAPKFIEEVKNKHKIVKGDDLVLNCRVRAKPKARTKWYLNSKLLIGENEEHFKLKNVQMYNTGMYRCVVRNTHGSIERLFTVDVLVPPFISNFDQLDVQLKEGTNATLDCDAKGSPTPTVKWVYNNTNWNLTNNSLHSTNITTQASGTFQCVATSAAGRASIVYRVVVIAPARVDDVMMFDGVEGVDVGSGVEIMKNKKIRISCHATGNPIPNVRWIKNGNTLSQNEDGIYYADLTVVVQSEDAGVYSCMVSNEGGSDERKIRLDVLEPPRISTSLFDNSHLNQTMKKLEVLSGQRFYLHCHPYGNPVPQIYWFKQGIPLKLYDGTMISTEFGEIIVADSASSEQSGNYTCVAVNKVGNTSYSYLVDVLVPPPSPKESYKAIRVRHGTSLKLTCPMLGTPPPDVLWVKHPYVELSEKLSDRIVLEDSNSTLVINSTVSTDSGQYTCHLSNKVGSSQISFNVSVEKAPSIVGGDSNHTGNVGDSVGLYCDCDGEPRPTVMWYKDAKPLTQSNLETVLDNRLLTIRHVESRDASQFVCVAENTVGVAYKRFYLFVKVPGKWSSWGEWGFCNATCGLGAQARGRACRYTDEYVTIDKASNSTAANVILDETGCKGSERDTRRCHMPPCEDDDQHWSPWAPWAVCSSTCGVGTQTRTRWCEGSHCLGDNLQIRKCPNLPSCDSNEIYNSREEVTEPADPYVPEAEYDLEPETYPEYPPDVEEFYVESATKSPKHFDVKVTQNLDRSPVGVCGPGYKYNASNGSCDDIDECAIENNQCHSTQACSNFPGGYRCACPPGYQAQAAGTRCLDINECTRGEHKCQFACVNTAGGYLCACPVRLRLHIDKHHCVPASRYRKKYIETNEKARVSSRG